MSIIEGSHVPKKVSSKYTTKGVAPPVLAYVSLAVPVIAVPVTYDVLRIGSGCPVTAEQRDPSTICFAVRSTFHPEYPLLIRMPPA